MTTEIIVKMSTVKKKVVKNLNTIYRSNFLNIIVKLLAMSFERLACVGLAVSGLEKELKVVLILGIL